MWQHARGSLGLPLVIFAAGLVGCANSAVDALQRDVAQLRQDLNGVSAAIQRSRGDSESAVSQVDRRTRTESAEITRQTSALAARLDNVAAELTRVSAQIDELSARFDGFQRQLAARAAAPPPPAALGPPATPGSPGPDQPAAAPAPAPAAGGPPLSSAQGPPVIAPAPARGSAPGPTADQAYQAAYLDFTKGSYPLAISGFREFVRRFPDSPRADEAQYWVGESYFSLARASAEGGRPDEAKGELEQAVQEFRRVVMNYPRGSRVPTALYKEGLALIELKQPGAARARLQYLVDNFPQSEEAPLARERLASLPPS